MSGFCEDGLFATPKSEEMIAENFMASFGNPLKAAVHRMRVGSYLQRALSPDTTMNVLVITQTHDNKRNKKLEILQII